MFSSAATAARPRLGCRDAGGRVIECGDVAAAALADRIAAALRDGATRLIIDLGDRDVGSTILRLLVATDRVTRGRGGMLVLCPGPSARTTLRATGLDLHLALAECVEDAQALVEAA